MLASPHIITSFLFSHLIGYTCSLTHCLKGTGSPRDSCYHVNLSQPCAVLSTLFGREQSSLSHHFGVLYPCDFFGPSGSTILVLTAGGRVASQFLVDFLG